MSTEPRTPTGWTGRLRRFFAETPKLALIPLALIAFVIIAVPVLAVVEVPGEKAIKMKLGFRYAAGQHCGEIRDRGHFGGEWRREASLGDKRDEVRATVIGRSAYLAGGIHQLYNTQSLKSGLADSVDIFQRYDFDSRRYVNLPPLPKKLNHVTIANYHGDVYVVGGHTDKLGKGEAVNNAWRYSVRERKWHELESMPTARGGAGSAVIGHYLYVIGGRNGDTRENVNEAYDFNTGHWTRLPGMHVGRDHLGVTAYKGQIYVVGGRASYQTYSLGTFERYDPAKRRWFALPDLPRPVSSIELAPVKGRLIAPGGGDSVQDWISGQTWAYNPKTEKWSTIQPMPIPKHGYGAAVMDGRMYLFGGSSCGQFRPSKSVESVRVPSV